MTREPTPVHPPHDHAPVQDIADDVAEHNADPTTRREALEQELESLDRSDDGAEVGDQMN